MVSIEAILSDPACLDGVPVDEIAEIAARCAAALVVLSSRTSRSASTGERMLTSEQVAERIGLSLSWVKQHPDQLPQARDIGGRPRWLASEIDQWLLDRPRYEYEQEARKGRGLHSAAAREILDSIPGRRAAV